MKFGSKVWIARGRLNGDFFFGTLRNIKGTLIGAKDNRMHIRLEEDDVLSSLDGANKRNDIVSCNRSAIILRAG